MRSRGIKERERNGNKREKERKREGKRAKERSRKRKRKGKKGNEREKEQKRSKILRTVLCKNSKNKDTSKFNINNQEVMDCIRIATEFNTHFVETGPKLSEIIDSSVNPLKYVKCNKTHIKLPCISEDEISRTINSLKNASAGWDNIPTFVVKKVSKHIIRPLTYLISKSI